MAILDGIKNWTQVSKDAFALLRDLCLFVLLLLLLIRPDWLGAKLASAGFGSIDAFGVKWQAQAEKARQDTLAAGATVAQTKQQADAALQKIDDLVKNDPSLASSVAPLQAQLVQTQKALTTADSRLASTAANQQALLQKAGAAASVAPLQGWAYLGSIDEGKTRWIKQNVAGPWPVRDGELRQVSDAVFVRAPGAAKSRSLARPLGAVQEGSSLQIEQVDTSVHLLAGGWTVWARVTAVQ